MSDVEKQNSVKRKPGTTVRLFSSNALHRLENDKKLTGRKHSVKNPDLRSVLRLRAVKGEQRRRNPVKPNRTQSTAR